MMASHSRDSGGCPGCHRKISCSRRGVPGKPEGAATVGPSQSHSVRDCDAVSQSVTQSVSV